jgi:4-amino-4-deoxy-L-arabinose transferase-like glycosyltransferase
LVLLLLLAWALSVPLAVVYPLHPDEALYGYWALRIGWGGDPWLASVPVYKPPLLPYLLTIGLALVGRSELSVRLLGLSSGLLMVPLSAALAHSLYHNLWTTAVAAVAVALSPLSLALSSTAFLDPPMVALGLAACLAASRGRTAWAGLLTGLSLAAKQTGLVWLPLVVTLYLIRSLAQSEPPNAPELIEGILLLGGTWLLIVGLVLGWDRVRIVQGAQSFWREGVVGYGGLRLIWPQEIWPRLRRWALTLRHIFAVPDAYGLLVVGLLFLMGRAIVHRFYTVERFIDLLLITFGLVYFLIHWLFAFPVWDRYFMPLVPVLAILGGRLFRFLIDLFQSMIDRLLRRRDAAGILDSGFPSRFLLGDKVLSKARWAIPVLILIALSITSVVYVVHRCDLIGGERATYAGMRDVTAFLRSCAEGSVVYHHWLGWQYHFYLFDAPLFLAYWPTPAWLAQDVMAFGEREPRYIVFPAWESSARVARALTDVGYRLKPVLNAPGYADEVSSFTVYRVESLSN